MINALIALIGVAVPMIGIYNLQKRFPVQNFVDLPDSAKSALFHPTWDIMLLFFIVAAVFVYTIATGKGRVTLIILGTYIAYGISSFIFYHKAILKVLIPTASIPRLTIFGIILLFSIYFLFKSQMGALIRSGMRDIAWWSALIQSIMVAGLLSSLLYTFLSPEETKLLSPLTNILIGNPEVQLIWIFAPFAWYAVLNAFKRE